jgi:NosR/NirI family transcriptional regulator, nitrous oxide reductase regulator
MDTARCRKLQKRSRSNRIFTAVALALILGAWVIGFLRHTKDIMPAVQQALPGADRFETAGSELYAGYNQETEQLVGYVALGEGNGYGGPLKVAVGLSPDGEILGLEIAEDRETPSYIQRVEKGGLLEDLLGRRAGDPLLVGEDLDAVTSATISSRAIAEAVRDGSRSAAAVLDLDVPSREEPPIEFGVPEFTLLALFGLGYVGHQRKFKHKKTARWISLLAGLLVLGFVYNQPLTLAYINKFLLGFWPRWQTHLYWYMLIGGILFVSTVDQKNPYCQWFCPFGAAQEVLGQVGGAKVYSPGRFRGFLKWLRQVLVLIAVVVALIYRCPGLTSYEIFGTLFSLTGSNLQFLMLALVLVTAMFVRRPWCTYLCPLAPVLDWIRTIRNWICELWQKITGKNGQE